MSKPWRLTPLVEDSLVSIALWTIETFDTVQAEAYEQELICRCAVLLPGQDSGLRQSP